MKSCSKCKNPDASFTKDSSRRDGLSFYCKACTQKGNSRRYHENKPARASANKAYVAANRAQVNERHRTWLANLRLKALHHYSDGAMCCECCEEPNVEFLVLDHKQGGGNQHRKTLKSTIWVWLRQNEYPTGFRVLCFNCNYAVIDGKECPHLSRASSRKGGILSGAAILANIQKGAICVTPFIEEHVNPASVDLTLGRGVLEYTDTELDARDAPSTRAYTIEDEGLVLQPGRAYLLHTEEVLHTDRYITVLDGKSSLGRLFIVVHATAGYIDPGFHGQVTLEVTVTMPVRVYAGMRFCQVRYHSIVGKITSYADTGHYVGSLARGAVASMAHAQLKEAEAPFDKEAP